MTLARTSVLNGLSTALKIATSLVLNKVLAVFVGPSGYAVIGQFQSLAAMVSTFAAGAMSTGVTKYTAQYREDAWAQLAVWRTAATMGMLGAVLFGVTLVAVRRPLASWAFGDTRYQSVVIWLAATLALLVANGIMLAILNGRRALVPYVVANITGSIVGATVAVTLVVRAGLYGALVAVVLSQTVAALATAVVFQRVIRVPWRALIGRIDPAVARMLGRFALMSLTSAAVVPLAHIAIREGLADRLGWHVTGLWQALWRISETHLMLLTTTLAVYFLPRFAEITDADELAGELRSGYLFVLPLVMLTAVSIFVVREPLIRALLTPEFLPITEALGWQLLGDVLKVGSWVMAYIMVSHGMTRAYIITEVVFGVVLAAAIVLMGGRWGLRGAAIGYTTTYALYWLVVLAVFRHRLAQLRLATPTPVTAPVVLP